VCILIKRVDKDLPDGASYQQSRASIGQNQRERDRQRTRERERGNPTTWARIKSNWDELYFVVWVGSKCCYTLEQLASTSYTTRQEQQQQQQQCCPIPISISIQSNLQSTQSIANTLSQQHSPKLPETIDEVASLACVRSAKTNSQHLLLLSLFLLLLSLLLLCLFAYN